MIGFVFSKGKGIYFSIGGCMYLFGMALNIFELLVRHHKIIPIISVFFTNAHVDTTKSTKKRFYIEIVKQFDNYIFNNG